MPHVLLTGGSGFIALHVLDALLSRGYSVVTTVRSQEKAEKIRTSFSNVDKAKLDFADSITEFKNTLATIGTEQGWTLADLKARFSNDLFDKLIFEEGGVAKAANGST